MKVNKYQFKPRHGEGYYSFAGHNLKTFTPETALQNIFLNMKREKVTSQD